MLVGELQPLRPVQRGFPLRSWVTARQENQLLAPNHLNRRLRRAEEVDGPFTLCKL